MFVLRPAVESEAGLIRSLIHAAQINPMGLDWRRFTVAVAPDGELIGCGQIKPHKDGSQELASLLVVPDWQGKGVARAIIESLIADRPGMLYLTCRARLQPLYEKFGFRVFPEREMPPYFRRLSRLVRIISSIARQPEGLRVMRRDPS